MNLINDLDTLKSALQQAIKIEHTTIPIYLTALYSIRGDVNQKVRDIIHHVLLEEMLHLTLAANVLISLGGKPNLCCRALLVDFPAPLMENDEFKVELLPFSKEAIHQFLLIEKPSASEEATNDVNHMTIGEFYDLIRKSLRILHKKLGNGIFVNRKDQVTGTSYYGPGNIQIVDDIDSALWALKTIRDQGEGDHHSVWEKDPTYKFKGPLEPAHYFRFKQILMERTYRLHDDPSSSPTGPTLPVAWNDAYPVHPNPKIADYAESKELTKRAIEFNQSYCNFLCGMNRAFNGFPEQMVGLVVEMRKLRELAIDLVRQPYPGKRGFNAGPTFELTPSNCSCASAE